MRNLPNDCMQQYFPSDFHQPSLKDNHQPQLPSIKGSSRWKSDSENLHSEKKENSLDGSVSKKVVKQPIVLKRLETIISQVVYKRVNDSSKPLLRSAMPPLSSCTLANEDMQESTEIPSTSESELNDTFTMGKDRAEYPDRVGNDPFLCTQEEKISLTCSATDDPATFYNSAILTSEDNELGLLIAEVRGQAGDLYDQFPSVGDENVDGQDLDENGDLNAQGVDASGRQEAVEAVPERDPSPPISDQNVPPHYNQKILASLFVSLDGVVKISDNVSVDFHPLSNIGKDKPEPDDRHLYRDSDVAKFFPEESSSEEEWVIDTQAGGDSDFHMNKISSSRKKSTASKKTNVVLAKGEPVLKKQLCSQPLLPLNYPLLNAVESPSKHKQREQFELLDKTKPPEEKKKTNQKRHNSSSHRVDKKRCIEFQSQKVGSVFCSKNQYSERKQSSASAKEMNNKSGALLKNSDTVNSATSNPGRRIEKRKNSILESETPATKRSHKVITVSNGKKGSNNLSSKLGQDNIKVNLSQHSSEKDSLHRQKSDINHQCIDINIADKEKAIEEFCQNKFDLIKSRHGSVYGKVPRLSKRRNNQAKHQQPDKEKTTYHQGSGRADQNSFIPLGKHKLPLQDKSKYPPSKGTDAGFKRHSGAISVLNSKKSSAFAKLKNELTERHKQQMAPRIFKPTRLVVETKTTQNNFLPVRRGNSLDYVKRPVNHVQTTPAPARADGLSPAPARADGRSPTAARADGRSPTTARADGRSLTAARADGRSPTAARADGRSPTAARADGRSPTAARADGRSPTAARADGRSPTAARADGRSPTAARADGRSPTAARADGRPPLPKNTGNRVPVPQNVENSSRMPPKINTITHTKVHNSVHAPKPTKTDGYLLQRTKSDGFVQVATKVINQSKISTSSNKLSEQLQKSDNCNSNVSATGSDGTCNAILANEFCESMNNSDCDSDSSKPDKITGKCSNEEEVETCFTNEYDSASETNDSKLSKNEKKVMKRKSSTKSDDEVFKTFVEAACERRLAQELPGYNWLEEKIKTGDMTAKKPVERHTKSANAPLKTLGRCFSGEQIQSEKMKIVFRPNNSSNPVVLSRAMVLPMADIGYKDSAGKVTDTTAAVPINCQNHQRNNFDNCNAKGSTRPRVTSTNKATDTFIPWNLQKIQTDDQDVLPVKANPVTIVAGMNPAPKNCLTHCNRSNSCETAPNYIRDVIPPINNRSNGIESPQKPDQQRSRSNKSTNHIVCAANATATTGCNSLVGRVNPHIPSLSDVASSNGQNNLTSEKQSNKQLRSSAVGNLCKSTAAIIDATTTSVEVVVANEQASSVVTNVENLVLMDKPVTPVNFCLSSASKTDEGAVCQVSANNIIGQNSVGSQNLSLESRVFQIPTEIDSKHNHLTSIGLTPPPLIHDSVIDNRNGDSGTDDLIGQHNSMQENNVSTSTISPALQQNSSCSVALVLPFTCNVADSPRTVEKIVPNSDQVDRSVDSSDDVVIVEEVRKVQPRIHRRCSSTKTVKIEPCEFLPKRDSLNVIPPKLHCDAQANSGVMSKSIISSYLTQASLLGAEEELYRNILHSDDSQSDRSQLSLDSELERHRADVEFLEWMAHRREEEKNKCLQLMQEKIQKLEMLKMMEAQKHSGNSNLQSTNKACPVMTDGRMRRPSSEPNTADPLTNQIVRRSSMESQSCRNLAQLKSSMHNSSEPVNVTAPIEILKVKAEVPSCESSSEHLQQCATKPTTTAHSPRQTICPHGQNIVDIQCPLCQVVAQNRHCDGTEVQQRPAVRLGNGTTTVHPATFPTLRQQFENQTRAEQFQHQPPPCQQLFTPTSRQTEPFTSSQLNIPIQLNNPIRANAEGRLFLVPLIQQLQSQQAHAQQLQSQQAQLSQSQQVQLSQSQQTHPQLPQSQQAHPQLPQSQQAHPQLPQSQQAHPQPQHGCPQHSQVHPQFQQAHAQQLQSQQVQLPQSQQKQPKSQHAHSQVHPQFQQAHPQQLQSQQANPQLSQLQQANPQLPQLQHANPQLPQSHQQVHPQSKQAHPHSQQANPQLPQLQQANPQLPQSHQQVHPQSKQAHPHTQQANPKLSQSHQQVHPQSHQAHPLHPQLPKSQQSQANHPYSKQTQAQHPQAQQSHPYLLYPSFQYPHPQQLHPMHPSQQSHPMHPSQQPQPMHSSQQSHPMHPSQQHNSSHQQQNPNQTTNYLQHTAWLNQQRQQFRLQEQMNLRYQQHRLQAQYTAASLNTTSTQRLPAIEMAPHQESHEKSNTFLPGSNASVPRMPQTPYLPQSSQQAKSTEGAPASCGTHDANAVVASKNSVPSQPLPHNYFDYWMLHCFNCQGTATFMCSECKKACYCSPLCQMANWEEHVKQCQASSGKTG